MQMLYTKKEAAKKLDMSVDTLNKMIADKKIKTVMINKRVKISEEAIKDTISGGREKIIKLASKLACAGYNKEQIEQIIDITLNVK